MSLEVQTYADMLDYLRGEIKNAIKGMPPEEVN